jgi:hypothetical protein
MQVPQLNRVQRSVTKSRNSFITQSYKSTTVISYMAVHRATPYIWRQRHHKSDTQSLLIIKCDTKRSVFSCLSENIRNCYLLSLLECGSPLALSSFVALTHVMQ